MTTTGEPMTGELPPFTETDLRVRLAHAESFARFPLERMRAMTQTGLVALRSLLLVNSGAIVALFTLLGHGDIVVVQRGLLLPACGRFAFGTAAALVAAGAWMLGQNSVIAADAQQLNGLYLQIFAFNRGEMPNKFGVTRGRFADFWRFAAAFGALASFLLFVWGCLGALGAVAPAATVHRFLHA
jgi:hypothetical protein